MLNTGTGLDSRRVVRRCEQTYSRSMKFPVAPESTREFTDFCRIGGFNADLQLQRPWLVLPANVVKDYVIVLIFWFARVAGIYE